MENSFLAGMVTRQGLPQLTHLHGERWRHTHGDWELVLRHGGPRAPIYEFGPIAIVIRGYLVADSAPPNSDDAVASVRRHYLQTGELPVDRLEGSFTLALLDGQAGRLLLYRNLVGNGFTYYREVPAGLLVGGNLAELASAARVALQPNTPALPEFFIYRYVPGRDTLLSGFHRLLPGEQLTYEAGRLRRVQRQKLGDWQRGTKVRRGAVDLLDATMGRVLADCAAVSPQAANLLSGGVDSSYVQAHWSRLEGASRRSFSVSVDHPRTRPDTDYALSAARILGTEHTLVPADAPYAEYLVETIAATAEPPHHVQTAYFGSLARAMVQRGVDAGLCGQGADALFGLGTANVLHNASVLRWCLRLPGLRWVVKNGAGAIGFSRLAYYARLAERLERFDDVLHPINRIGAYTDWDMVEACFGSENVAWAQAGRRALLHLHGVQGNLQEQLHACDFLTDSTDSAALWALPFQREGADLLCPYLDSRLVKLTVRIDPLVRFPFRRPKELLKKVLARHVGRELAWRKKLSFGQPIFEWLAPDGRLRPWIDRIGTHSFLKHGLLQRARNQPGWFLYSLLCYDLWHKLIIEGVQPCELARHSARPAA